MKVTPLELPEVLLIEPKVFGDDRGFFFESWAQARYAAAGIHLSFSQDNFSKSLKGTLRGLHLQHPHGQGKLVQALEGEVFDVAVDVRIGSPTFGKWVGEVLSAENHRQLWVPPGFAHGFCVLSDSALFHYKCTDTYHREHEVGVAHDDPDLGVPWPIESPLLSPKDSENPRLADIPPERLPKWPQVAH